MAVTTVASGNQVQQWRKKFFAEYVRESLFSAYYGTDENAIIQLVDDLGTKAGQTVNVPLVTRLTNSPITGDNTLEDNEEALGNYNHAITIDQVRNGVRVGKMEQKHTVIDLLNAARTMLKLWIMDDLRDDIIQAMKSPNVDGVTSYASSSETQKDAWLAANSDRVLFGAVKSNNSANDHSASLLNVDSTTDVLDLDIVQLGKRMFKTADRKMRPHRIKKGREWLVLFCESYSYRDLKADTETLHQNADVRGEMNKMFTDADLILDGVMCREVPENLALTNVGAGSSTDVGVNFLCGAQAIAVAWGQRSKFATDTFDYGNQRGVAVSEVRGVEKPSHNSVQHGLLTIYTSGVADS
jgi:N4-gp56 family major capsid protein